MSMNFVFSLIGDGIAYGPKCVAPIAPDSAPPLNSRGNTTPSSRLAVSSICSPTCRITTNARLAV